MRRCPVCNGDDISVTVERARLPVLQNKVYRTREEALSSPTAPFKLGTCRTCGFSFNAVFEPSLVVYDQAYDNEVPSPTFLHYYEQLAAMLIDRFQLTSGTVYDIGCGKGAFLRTLCRLAPGVRGIGIDPSCEPFSQENCTLIRDIFRPEYFADDARLVLLRHVLEHIATPVAFASALRAALPNVPLFVEVPDLHWIYRNNAFWDFCYEHCNYFSGASLAYVLQSAGFRVDDWRTSFGDQYQWAICASGKSPGKPIHGSDEVARAQKYHDRETQLIDAGRRIADEARGLVLWGMATKGVIFSNLMEPGRVAGGIDINSRKQGSFAAGSGVEIHSPEWLRTLDGRSTVLVMNPNYENEIRKQISALDIRAQVVVI
jgi:SAM-dependent methyltransferase